MKGGTVQIYWHYTKPVQTLDFHPISGLFATGGADFDIRLWLINSGQVQKNIPTASYQNSLSYHGSAVHALRFSPSGEQLASGADGGELIIWKLHTTDTGQSWKVFKSLLFHFKDVLDCNGQLMVHFSSLDLLIIHVSYGILTKVPSIRYWMVISIMFKLLPGIPCPSMLLLSVQIGLTEFLSISLKPKQKGVGKLNYICQHTILKAEQQPINDAKSVKNHLFHDETMPSFFRRLSWSPDGSFLLVPAGSYTVSASSETVNTTYVFSRKDLSRPSLQLPGASKPVVAVRFCPLAFNLRGSNPDGFFKLPYHLVFAVATLSSLYIYDTKSVPPIAILAGLHYAAITDIAWSYDACYLALSSQDGYCTLVEFEKDELGLPISLSESKIMNVENKSPIVQKPDDMVIEVDDSVTEDNRKTECAERREGKQAPPSLVNAPISYKPAKKRITPMVIDP